MQRDRAKSNGWTWQPLCLRRRTRGPESRELRKTCQLTRAGAKLTLEGSAGTSGYGTWAVTAGGIVERGAVVIKLKNKSSVTRLALPACLAALALTLTAAPALGFRGHAFTGVTFGSSGSGNGQLNGPTDAAVNEATGEVYVTDKGNNRVEVFSATGSYVGQFNGSGTLPGEGKAAGSGPGEVATGEFVGPTQIAVDNSCHLHHLSGSACTAFDPSNEDVYVLDEGHLVIDKFSRTGEYLAQIAGSPNGGRFETNLWGVAVAPDGTLAISALSQGNEVKPEVYSYTERYAERPLSRSGTCCFWFYSPRPGGGRG